MRRLVYLAVITLFTIILATTSCRKWPENGKLDGMWQIMSVEYSDGTTTSRMKYYYNFQRSICQLTGSSTCTGNMTYAKKEARLQIDFPESALSQLRPYGIAENPVIFKIIKLTNSSLILSNEYSTITFRKF